jgi:hypothetical protein
VRELLKGGKLFWEQVVWEEVGAESCCGTRGGGAVNCMGAHEYKQVFCEGGGQFHVCLREPRVRGSCWFGTGEGGRVASSMGVLGDGLVLCWERGGQHHVCMREQLHI